MKRVAIALSTLAALSVAATAAAKGVKITERSEDFTVSTIDQEAVDCGGKRAVAGGFFGEVDADTFIFPVVSSPDGESAWTFRGYLGSGSPGDATAYAYCAKKKRFPKLQESSEAETLDLGDFASVTADCPGTRRAISGGFELPDDFIFVTTSMRSGRGSWTVEFYNYDASDGSEVEAIVNCAKDVKLKERAQEITLAGEGAETEKARCKREQRVVSGGFDTKFDGLESLALGAASRRAGKRSWEATASAEGDPQPLTVYAYCLKKPKKK